MALPGWYSLFSVIEIHATLEGMAVAFFVALVVFDVLAHLSKKRETLFERIALVCFGVAVLAEVCAYPYSRRIDTLSKEASAATEGKIASLNKEAGDARKEAASANVTAKGFETQIAGANVRVKTAEVQIASANAASKDAVARVAAAEARIAEANRASAEANRIAEGERLARVRLELRMADRHLTPEQQSVITKKLCQFGGLNVEIGLYNTDGEMNALAKDIDGALPLLCPTGFGWAVSFSPVQVTEGFSGLQIFLFEGASPRVRLFASALSEALKSEGLQVGEPLPRPRFGHIAGGGGRARKFSADIPGTEAGIFVEIAIGKKP